MFIREPRMAWNGNHNGLENAELRDEGCMEHIPNLILHTDRLPAFWRREKQRSSLRYLIVDDTVSYQFSAVSRRPAK